MNLKHTRSGFIIAVAILALACGEGPTAERGPFDLSAAVLAPATTFPGDRVQTAGTANIRATASISGSLVGVQPGNAWGTVVTGPVTDVNGDRLTRWKVDFDQGPDGWAADAYLNQATPGPAIAAIAVSPAQSALSVGSTMQFTVSATDAGGAVLATMITWTTSNPAAATVSASGLVTATGAGVATITASSRGKSGTASVTSARFVRGGRVQAGPEPANIRAAGAVSGAFLGAQPIGAAGMVIAGPVVDAAGDRLTRWQVDFDTGPDGWAADAYLVTSGTPAVVGSVTLAPDTATTMVGRSVQLAAVAKDAVGATLPNAPLAWSSLDTLMGRVTSAGLVTAVAAGTVYIVVTSGGRSDTSRVTAVPVPVASVTLTPASAALAVADSLVLAAVLRDSAGGMLAGRVVTWATSNAQVATVSVAGVVRTLAAGVASITASSGGKADTTAVTVSSPSRPGFYAAPTGTSGGDGSLTRPWSLSTALAGAGGRVGAGDTIWLRGGTYRGSFRSTVSGAPGSPVVVRQYPGERAVIDGAGTPGQSQSVFYVGGSHAEFWDFELTNTDPTRTTSQLGNGIRPNVVANYASNTKYINLVVHDGGVAFYTEPAYTDVEITGCIIYNNGWQAPDRGHGHGLYLKSYVGPLTARENVVFNQFGYGIHAYTNAGSGELNNIRLEGNVSFNNGTQSTTGTSANILLGGDGRATADVVRDNFTWFSPGVGGTNVRIGYGSTPNGDATVQNNYFVGGSPVLDVGFWSSFTVSANTLAGSGTIVTLNDQQTSGHVWSGNTFQRDLLAAAWRYGGTAYNFVGWLAATGLGSGNLTLPGMPAATKVEVRPSLHGAGRANIIVYNWGRQGSTMVPLGNVLSPGDRYEIRNVQNLFGTPVAAGTFSGASVSLSLGGVTPPAPVGWANRAPRSGPDFDVFVVRKI